MNSNVIAGRCHVSIEIVGDYLALLVLYMSPIIVVSDRFFVFDWKAGTHIMVRMLSQILSLRQLISELSDSGSGS
jgi:hypothetical protein